MYKRFISLFLSFSLLSISAHASSNVGLKAAYDELNYALTVEWDQKDKVFYIEQMERFAASIGQLRSEGLSNSELVEFVKTEAQDQKLSKDIDQYIQTISLEQLTTNELAEKLLSIMKSSYAKGATWDGKTVLNHIGASLLLVVLLYPFYLVYKDIKENGVNFNANYDIPETSNGDDDYNAGYNDGYYDGVNSGGY